jgi:hypothetical protein
MKGEGLGGNKGPTLDPGEGPKSGPDPEAALPAYGLDSGTLESRPGQAAAPPPQITGGALWAPTDGTGHDGAKVPKPNPPNPKWAVGGGSPEPFKGPTGPQTAGPGMTPPRSLNPNPPTPRVGGWVAEVGKPPDN